MTTATSHSARQVHLAEALREQGVTSRNSIFPDEVHDFLWFQHWIVAAKAAEDFFDRKLRR